jgi:hypothetical protein
MCLAPETQVMHIPADAPPSFSSRVLHDPLLLALCAACALQGLALAGLLVKHLLVPSRQPANAAGPADRTKQHMATSPPKPPKPSLRDACTSPLVAMLASPLFRSKASVRLETVEEAQEEGQQEDQQHPVTATAPTVEPLPVGWTRCAQTSVGTANASNRRQQFANILPQVATRSFTPHQHMPCRDAWGRLQRHNMPPHPAHSRFDGWGGKPVMHPPPFGSAPGAAFRTMSEE